MTIEVRDETDCHASLREQIEDIVIEVAPLVADVTGLSLPSRVVYRLITPTVWKHESIEAIWALLARDIAELSPSGARRTEAKTDVQVQTRLIPLVWPLVMGQTIETGTGTQTHLVPATLKHTGVLSDERFLCQVVVHELVRQMQHAAGANGWRTFMPDLRGLADRAISHLIEGHARWADQLVTAKLFGTPVDAGLAPWSDLYRKSSQHPEVKDMWEQRHIPYRQGTQFVGAVVAVGGTDAVNRIWGDREMIPRTHEILDPGLWLQRYERSPHTAAR
ncbi:zinc-dependent metalloprotease [Streptomyces sp. NPDC057617]|uniref:zinc-dependent metalloprotease n=1 Tax=unclassified Streptomyces TaxID=2593676 RepID=UPI0036C2E0E6